MLYLVTLLLAVTLYELARFVSKMGLPRPGEGEIPPMDKLFNFFYFAGYLLWLGIFVAVDIGCIARPEMLGTETPGVGVVAVFLLPLWSCLVLVRSGSQKADWPRAWPPIGWFAVAGRIMFLPDYQEVPKAWRWLRRFNLAHFVSGFKGFHDEVRSRDGRVLNYYAVFKATRSTRPREFYQTVQALRQDVLNTIRGLLDSQSDIDGIKKGLSGLASGNLVLEIQDLELSLPAIQLGTVVVGR